MELLGRIKSIVQNTGFMVYVPFSKTYLIARYGIQNVRVVIEDKRTIGVSQRKAIYALFNDISDWSGYAPEETKAVLKYLYIAETGCEYFSLSNCSITAAHEFIEYLIEFCLYHSVPTKKSLQEHAPDIGRYIYACLANKKSCLSNMPAELHHLDAVGMGNNRNKIIHEGMLVLPLTREEHTEAHKIGKEEFCRKYHIFGIRLNKELCDIWDLNY